MTFLGLVHWGMQSIGDWRALEGEGEETRESWLNGAGRLSWPFLVVIFNPLYGLVSTCLGTLPNEDWHLVANLYCG